MHLIKTMPMKRHKSVARLFDEDFGRCNDEVRKKVPLASFYSIASIVYLFNRKKAENVESSAFFVYLPTFTGR